MKKNISVDENFWNKMAKKYFTSPIQDIPAYQEKLKKTQEYLKSNMQVLEIGCGTGGTALLHAPYVKHIHAIDISNEMIKLAMTRPEYKNVKNVTFEVKAIDQINFPQKSFDAILALNILHLLKNPAKTITSLYHILKPNGMLFISVSCMKDMHSLFLTFLKIIGPLGHKLRLLPNMNFFSQQEFENFLKSAGFSIIFIRPPTRKNASVFIIAKKF